jgi:hypothetical protein
VSKTKWSKQSETWGNIPNFLTEELRVLCENDAKEAMEDTHFDRMMALQAEDSEVPVAGSSTDPVE